MLLADQQELGDVDRLWGLSVDERRQFPRADVSSVRWWWLKSGRCWCGSIVYLTTGRIARGPVIPITRWPPNQTTPLGKAEYIL